MFRTDIHKADDTPRLPVEWQLAAEFAEELKGQVLRCKNPPRLVVAILFLEDRPKIVLKGALVGDWADSLPRTIAQCGSAGEVEIDLDGITCVDHAGVQALLTLWRPHRHFVCSSTFPRTLCENLGIPVEGSTEA
jgi:ABC-type transporter Mla MlaB component